MKEAARIVAILFVSRDQAHREHLKTRSYAQHMAHWLAASPAGTVLMCHPGGAPAAGDAPDPIATARQWECAHLAGPAFAAECATAGVERVRGRALYPARF